MTSKQLRLFPECHDQIRALMCGSEIVARCMRQLIHRPRAVLRERMKFQPSPQVFDRIEFGRVRRQAFDVYVTTTQSVEVLPHEPESMRGKLSELIGSGCSIWARSAFRNSTICGPLIGPG